MTITVTPVSNTQTFGAWLAVTNRLANIVSQNTVTADATVGGSVTTGNSFVNGHFGTSNLVLGPSLNSANSVTIQVANSTLIANGQYYLNANGSWERVVTDAAGGNTQVQFNSSNSFAGSADFTYDSAATKLTVGNTTVNAAVTPTGFALANASVSFTLLLPNTTQVANGSYFLNANGSWEIVKSGGGYYKGNVGDVGDPNNTQNLFRINANTLTANVTILAGENAQVTGPVSIANGAVLTIDSGGRVAVI
jgi:hypothetical protein